MDADCFQHHANASRSQPLRHVDDPAAGSGCSSSINVHAVDTAMSHNQPIYQRMSHRHMQEYAPCKAATFQNLPALLAPGKTPSDHYYALVTACDLLTRTVQDRKLLSARKSIIVVSPFLAPTPPVQNDILVPCPPPCSNGNQKHCIEWLRARTWTRHACLS
jgi:hypothetical protein